MLEVLNELFTSRFEEHKYVSYDGDYDFFIEPLIEGELPYQTASLSYRCYKNKMKKNLVVTECKWYRVFEGKYSEITEAEGNEVYHLSPYDIGCSIRVAIKADGISGIGLAFVTFGPIELDSALKPYIENHLLCLKGSF